MYIKKYWWVTSIGCTDDSLTLTDYLYDKGKSELSLSEIFQDTGLDKLNWNFRTSPGTGYTDSNGVIHDLHYAIQVALDLAALLLECKKSGGFNIMDLYENDRRNLFINITTTPEEEKFLNEALKDFVAHPLEYDLLEMESEAGMLEIAEDCEQVRKGLFPC